TRPRARSPCRPHRARTGQAWCKGRTRSPEPVPVLAWLILPGRAPYGDAIADRLGGVARTATARRPPARRALSWGPPAGRPRGGWGRACARGWPGPASARRPTAAPTRRRAPRPGRPARG